MHQRPRRRHDLLVRPAIAVVLALLGCAQAVHRAAPARDPWAELLHAVGGEVERARGRHLPEHLEVLPLDDAEFEARASARLNVSPAAVADLVRTFSALKLAPVTAPGPEALSFRDAAGYYDVATQTVLVRRSQWPRGADPLNEQLVAVIAHELGHALQGERLLAEAATFDEGVAHAAIIEGDASLTEALVLGARHGLDATRAVERARLDFAASRKRSRATWSGNPSAREMNGFRYVWGTRFVAELFRAGGFPLVDQLLDRPPPDTATLLAPQPWLDGATRERRARVGAALFMALAEDCFADAIKGDEKGRDAMDWLLGLYEDDAFRADAGSLAWTVSWRDDPAVGLADGWAAVMRRSLKCLGHREADFSIVVSERSATAVVCADASRRPGLAAALPTLRAVTAPPPFGPQRVPPPSPEVAGSSASTP